MSSEDPAIREESRRNPDGTFKQGFSGNPSGRPKNTLKDYVRQKFMNMTEEEKEAFISKLNPDVLWKMAEGNPHQTSEIEASGSLTINFAPIFKQDADTPPGAGESNTLTSEVQDNQSRS